MFTELRSLPINMSCSLNSLNGGLYGGLFRGLGLGSKLLKVGYRGDYMGENHGGY